MNLHPFARQLITRDKLPTAAAATFAAELTDGFFERAGIWYNVANIEPKVTNAQGWAPDILGPNSVMIFVIDGCTLRVEHHVL